MTMTTPSDKNPKMAEYLEWLYGRTTAIAGDTCAACQGPATAFSDELSRAEYKISGLCQTCQDIAFADTEEEDQ
jgi:hypothetical protein